MLNTLIVFASAFALFFADGLVIYDWISSRSK